MDLITLSTFAFTYAIVCAVPGPGVAAIVARGSLAVRRSVAEASLQAPGPHAPPRHLAAAYRQFEFGEPIPHHANYLELMSLIIQPEIDRMVLGELTPEEAGRRAAAAVDAFLVTFDPKAS